MEQFQVTIAEGNQGTVARSRLYRQLSGLFACPVAVTTAGAKALEVMTALRGGIAALPYALDAKSDLLRIVEEFESWAAMDDAETRSDLESVYTALFDNCRGRAAVSLYEKDYGNGDAKMVWEEVIRFYEHFGLEFDVRQRKDWPDHIGTELEFMHYLTFLEAAVPESDRDVYVQAQKDFLSRRLARWAPRFAMQLNGAMEPGPYGLFAQLAAAFVKAEMSYLDCPIEDTGHWVPMCNGQPQVDAKGRTIFPIINVAELEESHY